MGRWGRSHANGTSRHTTMRPLESRSDATPEQSDERRRYVGSMKRHRNSGRWRFIGLAMLLIGGIAAAAVHIAVVRSEQRMHRERLIADSATVQAQLDLLVEVPGHEHHMEAVHDALNDLMDADGMDTLTAGLRQLRQISRRAHALASGADTE